ncbi:YcxB family protein [Methylobacterium sp. A49B]
MTPDDLSRAFRLHYRIEARRWPTFLAATITLIVLGGFLHLALPNDPMGVAIVFGCGVFGAIAVPFAMIRWIVPRRARLLHARSKLARAPVQLDADTAAVRFNDMDGVTNVPWAGIVRWREDAHVILLYYAPRLFHIVPQHALASEARERLRHFHDYDRRARPNDGTRPPLDGIGTPEGIAPTRPVLAASRSWIVTRADLVAAQRLHLRWRWRQPRTLLQPLFLAACAGIVTVATEPTAALWQAALAMLGMLLFTAILRVALYALLPLGIGDFRRRQPNLGLDWRVELDAVGLRALTAQQDVRTPWNEYIAWAEDARMLLVYRDDTMFQFMPARACDAAFTATFRDLVASLPRR